MRIDGTLAVEAGSGNAPALQGVVNRIFPGMRGCRAPCVNVSLSIDPADKGYSQESLRGIAESWDNTLTALKRSKSMDGLDQIGSTLGDFLYAVLHPSVANLPAGFLVLVFAVLMIAALPESARAKMRLAGLAAVGLIVSLSLTWPVTSAILR